MASYPGAVKSFVSRNAGDVIQPAHVNDLQDEVTAIEAGLLNGTAPLNSSHSTLATLSVTGGTTLAGTLQVTGGSTFAGNVTVSGTLTVGPFTFSTVVTADAQPRCRIFHGSTQTIGTSTETALTFNSEDFDPQGLHSTASNPTRITPGSTGLWIFGATANFTPETQAGYIRFFKNSTTTMGSAVGFVGDGAVSQGHRVQATAIEIIASSADYVEVFAWQNAGVGIQVGNASSRIDQNEFWAAKLW